MRRVGGTSHRLVRKKKKPRKVFRQKERKKDGETEKRCVSGCSYVANPCLSKEEWERGRWWERGVRTHTPAANRATPPPLLPPDTPTHAFSPHFPTYTMLQD